MKSFSVIVLLLVGLFMSCKSNSDDGKKTVLGYEYEVLTKGNGSIPAVGDVVSFDINILDPEGKVLQSSSSFRERPTMVIPEVNKDGARPNPILEILKISVVGDSIDLYMPKDSMQGAPPAMENLEYVKYVIAVKDIKSKESFDTERKAALGISKARETKVAELVKSTIADYKDGKSKVVSLESGLKYIIHKEGTGTLPEIGKNVSVNYYGALLSDGSMFDNSFKRGKEFSFPLGQGRVIKGWDEGIAKLKKGTTATLIIPGDLGYGKAGSPPNIPGDATLVFYVEVL